MRYVRPARLAAIALAAVAAFTLASWLPVPAAPDAARGELIETIERRMPGWDVHRIGPSWEGAHTVVTSCAGRTVDFQYVPGHGLPAGHAWLQPSDDETRRLLARVSDHDRYLIWTSDRPDPSPLSCPDELAQREPDEADDPRRATMD